MKPDDHFFFEVQSPGCHPGAVAKIGGAARGRKLTVSCGKCAQPGTIRFLGSPAEARYPTYYEARVFLRGDKPRCELIVKTRLTEYVN